MPPTPPCPRPAWWWGVWASLWAVTPLGIAVGHIICGFSLINLFFLPVILPSEIPRLPTNPLERVFPGVWKLLSFLRLPSPDGSLSLPLLSLFLSFIFCPTSFRRQWAVFLVPGVLRQRSEFVLWHLLGIQMIFWWIFWGESGLPVLVLNHLRNQWILKKISHEYSLEGLMLKLQYSGHLMWRSDSLEKTLILGKIEGWKGMKEDEMVGWLINLMDMSLNKLQELVMDREVWRAAVPGIANSQIWLSNWTELRCFSRNLLVFL